MTIPIDQDLADAWKRLDERLSKLQIRHRQIGDIPLYEAHLNPPATENELSRLEAALGATLPHELSFSLRHWNGRWIAHDHGIDLAPVSDLIKVAQSGGAIDEYRRETYERVTGPINPTLESMKRYLFGSHEYSGSNLYLDYEDPPEGGRPGQVIRVGEEPVAEFVAASFVDFLNMIAEAPAHDDDPDFDPLRWRP